MKFASIVAPLATVAALVSTPAWGAGATATPDPTIYAIGYENDYLYIVDVDSGTGTQFASPIGMGDVQHLGASFNPADGVLYATNGDNSVCALWAIDVQTGVGEEALPLDFVLPDSNSIRFCTAMAFTPEGDLFVGLRSEGGTNYVTQVDFATGDLIQAWEAPLSSIPNFLVVSPEDGVIYMQTSGADDDMYTFDPTDPTSAAFVNVADGNNQTMYGAAFLPDGTILANSWSDLVSVNLDTLGSWSTIGTIANTDIGVLVNGTQYWPADEADSLASTGFDLSGALAGAVVILAVGVVVVVRRRTA